MYDSIGVIHLKVVVSLGIMAVLWFSILPPFFFELIGCFRIFGFFSFFIFNFVVF